MRPRFFLLMAGLMGSGILFFVWLGLASRSLDNIDQSSDGFDLSRHSIPLDQIVSGGPGKNGIPAILKPSFVSASEAIFLADEDRILGITQRNEAKAYPIKILNWHEIVNDTIDGNPVVVTYCPLCGTGIGFDAEAEGQWHTFGVSGLLYQSDLLMYDHQTESLWSQIAMEAVAGPLTGARLTPIFLQHTTWSEWRATHPTTLVLSTRTGHPRNYDRDPYLGYAQRPDLMFAVTRLDQRYHQKEWALGVTVNGIAKAYPFTELRKARLPLTDQVNGRTIRVHFNSRTRSVFVTDTEGKPMPAVTAFWFAWYAFHPDTQIFTAP